MWIIYFTLVLDYNFDKMSVEQEIDRIVAEERQSADTEIDDTVTSLALHEVTVLLATTGDSLGAICSEIEAATSKEGCRTAFRRFNSVIRIFLLSAREGCDRQVAAAICSLTPSDSFRTLLEGQARVREAISLYKQQVLRELAETIHKGGATVVVSEEKDDELFAQFLPELGVVGSIPAEEDLVVEGIPHRKRGVSQVLTGSALTSIPKKKRSSIPALNVLTSLTGGEEGDSAGSKRKLLTREKLRAGLHDPKGLLNLTGPSTNALERTKKLELLKGAGYEFNFKGKSFYDRLNAAELRLDLGLGGHSVSDTLLFGAKVLSLPGFLTRKNITEIENNVVNGGTT